MEIDAYFEKLGEYGRYNVILLPLICIIGAALPSWHILSSVFIFYEPPHHCKTDRELNESIPFSDNGEYDNCVMYADVYSDNQSTSTVPCQDGWSYDVDGNGATVVTEMDLVCGKSIYAANAISIYFAGILFGALTGGHLSDMLGRKRMLFVGLIGGVATGVCLTFTHSYAAFVVVWFCSAVFQTRILSECFSLIIEFFSSKLRTLATCWLGLGWALGVCVLTPIAYKFQNWRHFELAISLPTILAFPSWWFIVESPRWLMSKNRWSEARAAFRKIAKFNNIPDDKQTWIETIHKAKCVNVKEENAKSAKFYSILDTVRTPRLRKNTLLMFYIWFVNSMVYYGFSFNSSKIMGDRFINFSVMTLAEIPACIVIFYALPRYGRRHLLLLFHTIAAIACITVAFVPDQTEGGVSLYLLITTLVFIGKFCIGITFTVIWMFASEIYPTVIRTTGVGVCSMFARFGGIAAPYAMYLEKAVGWLPMVVFGVLSLGAGVAALPIPETLNKPLPQTIEDAENPRNVQLVDKRNEGTSCDLGVGLELMSEVI